MKKKIKSTLFVAVALAATATVYFSNRETTTLSSLTLANIEALANDEDGTKKNEKTYQITDVTETIKETNDNGECEYSVSGDCWILNGEVSYTQPTTSEIIEYVMSFKCCRKKGDVKSCDYENC